VSFETSSDGPFIARLGRSLALPSLLNRAHARRFPHC
jgi:hypothetical protein